MSYFYASHGQDSKFLLHHVDIDKTQTMPEQNTKLLQSRDILNHYLLVKGGYVFGNDSLFACLLVCLFITTITLKLMN